MKKILIGIFFLGFIGVSAQEYNFDQQLNLLTNQLDSLITQKNKLLRQNIDSLTQLVREQKISAEKANEIKTEIAKKYADEIDYAAFRITSKIKDLAKGKTIEHKVVIKNPEGEIGYTIRVIQNNRKKTKEIKKKKRTSSDWFIAFGINNVLVDGDIENINDSPYGIGNSRFFRIGKEWKTSFTKEKGPFYFTYGLDYTWNTLKPDNNKYHVVINDQLYLDTYPETLKYSKLRTKWLRAPVGIEWHIPGNSSRYLKIKAGGFARVNMTTKQKLKVEGDKKIVNKSGFDVNGFNYGFFGEIGGHSWTIMMEYDGLSFFKSRDWKHFMLGLKWNL
jgi:hypothetical protein